jgi:hypothetical protein
MECKRSYRQKHAAARRKLKRKWSSKTMLNWPMKGDSRVLMSMLLRNCCSPMARASMMTNFENQQNTSRANLQPLTQRTPVQELSTEFLSKSTSTIMQIMDWFIDNDPVNEWSLKAKQDKVFLK